MAMIERAFTPSGTADERSVALLPPEWWYSRDASPADSSESRYLLPARPSFQLTHDHINGQWIIKDQVVGVFGQGDDLGAALQDFVKAVTEHLDVLQRQDQLSDELSFQLRYLQERVG